MKPKTQKETQTERAVTFSCPLQEMHIQLSSATYEHLKGSHFIFERRGTITIKVRGPSCCSGNCAILVSMMTANVNMKYW